MIKMRWVFYLGWRAGVIVAVLELFTLFDWKDSSINYCSVLLE